MDGFSAILRDSMDSIAAEIEYEIQYGNLVYHQLGRTRPTAPNRDKWIAERVAEKREERRLDAEVGPKLGPGRFEYRMARVPFENYKRIRKTMPGKTPGVFINLRGR